jgi:hypothetical protein
MIKITRKIDQILSNPTKMKWLLYNQEVSHNNQEGKVLIHKAKTKTNKIKEVCHPLKKEPARS